MFRKTLRMYTQNTFTKGFETFSHEQDSVKQTFDTDKNFDKQKIKMYADIQNLIENQQKMELKIKEYESELISMRQKLYDERLNNRFYCVMICLLLHYYLTPIKSTKS